MRPVMLRCQQCGTVNRVSADKIQSEIHCGNCKAKLSILDRTIDVTSANFGNDVLQWPGVVLVDFWSQGCVHCMRLSPVLDELAREKAGLVRFAKVNAAYEPALSVQYGVQGVPNLILFENGQVVARLPGAVPKENLKAWIYSATGF